MGKTQSWFSLEVGFGAWNKERTKTLTFHRYLVLFFRFCSKYYFDYLFFRVSSFYFSKMSWASLQQCGLTYLSQHSHVHWALTTHRMDTFSPLLLPPVLFSLSGMTIPILFLTFPPRATQISTSSVTLQRWINCLQFCALTVLYTHLCWNIYKNIFLKLISVPLTHFSSVLFTRHHAKHLE